MRYCEWVDASSPVSLIEDIKKAEDISIRHGDAHPYGAVRRDARERCEAKLFAVMVLLRKVRVRFPDDRAARVVAVLLLSIGLGILVVGVGQVWAFAVEGVRIGTVISATAACGSRGANTECQPSH